MSNLELRTKMAESVEHYVANDAEWEAYKVKFGKNYEADEEASK